MMRRLTFFACLLLAACDSPTVPERFLRDVYDFRVITPQPKVLRWPIGTTVRVYVSSDGDAARTQWLESGLANAINVWNDAAIYGEVKVQEVKSLQDADAVVAYNTVPYPVDASGCIPSGGAAYTTFCLAAGGERLAVFPLRDGGGGHVKFLVTIRGTSATDEAAVRRLLTHEIGHVLGIGQHSPKQTDLMYAGVLLRDDASPADRATLQILYHSVPDIVP